MKVAVLMRKNKVSGHFGQSDAIQIKGEVESIEVTPHSGGALPMKVISLRPDVVISGGMGNKAYQKLVDAGIKIYKSPLVRFEEAIDSFEQGKLELFDETCAHEAHEHHHGHDHNHKEHHHHHHH